MPLGRYASIEGKIRDRELPAEEHRHAQHFDTAVDAGGGEAERLRGEHRHVVSPCQLPRERGHHHPAATPERWVLVVAKQDLQAAKLLPQSGADISVAEGCVTLCGVRLAVRVVVDLTSTILKGNSGVSDVRKRPNFQCNLAP